MDTYLDTKEKFLFKVKVVENQYELKGLGGWLILVGIGVVINPIFLLVTLYSSIPLFSDGSWEALTTIGQETYHPLWGPLIIGEIIYNLVMLALTIYLIYLFFSKHYRFPKFFIAIIVASLIFILLDAWIVTLILPSRPILNQETINEIARAFGAGIIWIPYMLVSKRVKATFVEKMPNKSLQPSAESGGSREPEKPDDYYLASSVKPPKIGPGLEL